MRCTQCDFGDTRVIESRTVGEGESIRRRRECPICKVRFTTYERVELPQLVVVKNNNTRELFSRDKLLAGLIRACEKTPVSKMQLESVVDHIEKELIEAGESEISSRAIGEIVIEHLADVNEVAYVRFASVYRRFDTLASFEAELARIRAHRKTKKL
ncbi:transcriptional regulator NrdR [Candidatus Saccharibacteria bacterium]|nr:transcriptional regulator NrdR [Candidatus Saccharibacteria bacterium]MCB9821300.1 transcriptional regulator NrdR [Candidatus Nomurabacteria bacterium]